MSRRGTPASVAVVVAALVPLLACGPGAGGLSVPETPPPARVPAGAAAEVAAGRSARVLLLLDPARVARTPRADRVLTPGEHARRVQDFADAKRALLEQAPAGVRVKSDYDQLPILLVDVSTAEAWEHLLADPRVLRLEEDGEVELSLDSTLAFIQQPHALAEGKDGAGVSVAVLDTGANYTHAAFGSCTAPGVPSSTCRVPFAKDFALEDNMMDDSGKHGTNVSAIVAGVAPGAKIIPLDVFNGTKGSSTAITEAINWVIANKATYNIAAMNMSFGSGAYTALCPSFSMSLSVDEARKAGILSAVASGNDGYSNAVGSPACAPAAVSVGAVYDGNIGARTSSVCTDATTAAGQVTCFSNSASFVTLLAPGVNVSAGGVTMSGTSMAAPHVAGALAVLRAAFPSESTDELVTRLTSSGVSTTDSRNGVTRPRLQLAAAAAGCVLKLSPSSKSLTADEQLVEITVTTSAACSWTASSSNPDAFSIISGSSGKGTGTLTVKVAANTGAARAGTVTVSSPGAASKTTSLEQATDTAPPTGTVQVNAGATFTANPAVTLALTGSDVSGVASMCISNNTTCTTFQPFATSVAWTLTTGQGLKTVRVLLRDGKGNTSAAISGTITLDAAAPTGGALTASHGVGANTLGWTAATDSPSGVDRYRLVFAVGTPPASCAAGVGTLAFEGNATGFTHSGLTNGTSYGYRLCAVDRAGNTAAGVTASARPRLELNPPTGTVTLEGGAAFSRSPTVSLAIAASDASAVTSMCLSNGATCAATAWVPFAALVPAWTLPTAQGSKTVSVWLRDEWGNTTAAPLTDGITLDTVAPTGGALTATFGNQSNALSWTAATDATSGLDRYKLVFAEGTSPASCAPGVGTVAYEGSATSFTHAGLTNGTTYGYRVCPVDKAGNVGTGVVASAKPRPEPDAPSGTVTLNGGADFSTQPTLALAISAADASAITQMCISTAATCAATAWVPFSTSTTVPVSTAPGVKKVSVWLRDEWGNTTVTPLSDTLTFDAVAPTGGALVATFGNGLNTLAWTAATDATAGVDRYRLVFAAGTAPASCAAGTLIYEGASLSHAHAGLTNGTTYGYRVCAVDKAGNVAAGAVASAKPRPEANAPTGSVSLNGGAAFTTQASVAVALAVTDASNVTEMCTSTGSTCAATAWVPFAAQQTVTVSPTSGIKKVSVWLRDEWGNTTSTPLTGSITLDVTPPGPVTLTKTAGSKQVSLSWTAATDALSGLKAYKVVQLAGTTVPLAACTDGTVVYQGTGTAFVASGLAGDASYAYRVCAVDNLGNTSTGASTTVKTLP
ncbi:MAG: hypothetical protein RL653_480 [Pseudomonadota bacterium]|jgi:subtilisin family serine protease